MNDIRIGSAAILAGGMGTRLRRVVPDRPKVLVEIGGRPFIQYLLDQIAGIGLRSVVLCTGYESEMVERQLAGHPLELVYSRESMPLGTGGALRNALPALARGPVLVLNGDSFCDAPLAAFADWHVSNRHSASLVVSEVEDCGRYGRVRLDAAQRIVAFDEKSSASGPGMVNAGIYLFERDVIGSIPAGREVSLERELFPSLVGKGLRAYPTSARLWDIGVPDAYEVARASFAASLRH